MLTENDLIKMASDNPYKDNGCPICGEHAVSSCRCMGPHSLEMLKKGHGLKCASGHRWSGKVSYDPSPDKVGEEVAAPQTEKTPIRKVYDAAAGVAGAAVGAVGAGIQGLQSLDNRSPIRKIE